MERKLDNQILIISDRIYNIFLPKEKKNPELLKLYKKYY